jgi:radical SAM superfamily enzyme YgiQ (UPF0313 family)
MTLHRIWTMFTARNREFFRDRAAFGWNFLFPFLLVAGFAVIFGGREFREYTVGVFPVTDAQPAAETLAIPDGFRQLKYARFVGFADQVQAFLPSPMATATAMWHSGKNPLGPVRRDGEDVIVVRGLKQRRLHKAFLRYHDPDNWPTLRAALRRMGRADLIGNGRKHLIPAYQPRPRQRTGHGGRFRTQHVR